MTKEQRRWFEAQTRRTIKAFLKAAIRDHARAELIGDDVGRQRAEVRFKAWLLVAQSSRDLFRTWTTFQIGMGMAKSAAMDHAIRLGEDIDNLIVQGPPRTTEERAAMRAVRAAAIRNGYFPE